MAAAYQEVVGIGVHARVRRTIQERGLLSAGESVLVACSGGSDSIALLHILAALDRGLFVASVDHGLRDDSAHDVAFVAARAKSLSVPFLTCRLSLSAGPNLHARARAARYQALHALAEECGATAIAVGHTRDDQAETVLSRVLRGGGLVGLGGIRPRRADGVVRPLLDCGRDELREWLSQQGLTWRDDPSNLDTRYERTRLRSLLASLREEDPSVVQHLAFLADDARAAGRVLADAADRWEGALAEAPEAVRRVLLRREVEAVSGRPVGRAHLEALDRMVRSGRGEVRVGGGFIAGLQNGRILVRPVDPPRAAGEGDWKRTTD